MAGPRTISILSVVSVLIVTAWSGLVSDTSPTPTPSWRSRIRSPPRPRITGREEPRPKNVWLTPGSLARVSPSVGWSFSWISCLSEDLDGLRELAESLHFEVRADRDLLVKRDVEGQRHRRGAGAGDDALDGLPEAGAVGLEKVRARRKAVESKRAVRGGGRALLQLQDGDAGVSDGPARRVDDLARDRCPLLREESKGQRGDQRRAHPENVSRPHENAS